MVFLFESHSRVQLRHTKRCKFTRVTLVLLSFIYGERAAESEGTSDNRHPLMLGRDDTESFLVEWGKRASVRGDSLVIKVLAVTVANKRLRG